MSKKKYKKQIVREVVKSDGTVYGYMIFCPGCQDSHVFDRRWGFDGSMESPTFTGSMLVDADDPSKRCHSHVINGSIQFLHDCFHSLKGQTVKLEPF